MVKVFANDTSARIAGMRCIVFNELFAAWAENCRFCSTICAALLDEKFVKVGEWLLFLLSW